MKSLLIIGCLAGLLWFTPGHATEIDLAPSQLLEPTQLILAQAVEDSSSFSEVKRPDVVDVQPKDPWRAFGSSLLIPGWGQRYIDSGFKSKIFFSAEVGAWAALLVFRREGAWREDDYRLLAQVEAGADLTDKDEHYFDVLGFYDNREEYNKLGGVYNRDQQYFPDNTFYFWKWSSAAARTQYRTLKNDSKSYYRKANFALGVLIANHVLSAVDAYFGAKRHNRHVSSGFWGVDMQVPENGGFLLTVRAGF